MLTGATGPVPEDDEAAWELLGMVTYGLGYYDVSTYLMTCRMNPEEVAARITQRVALARVRLGL
jgi:hypothetical protein